MEKNEGPESKSEHIYTCICSIVIFSAFQFFLILKIRGEVMTDMETNEEEYLYVVVCRRVSREYSNYS